MLKEACDQRQAVSLNKSFYTRAFFRGYYNGLVWNLDLLLRLLMTGNEAFMSSKQISCFYDLHGSSVTVDT